MDLILLTLNSTCVLILNLNYPKEKQGDSSHFKKNNNNEKQTFHSTHSKNVKSWIENQIKCNDQEENSVRPMTSLQFIKLHNKT